MSRSMCAPLPLKHRLLASCKAKMRGAAAAAAIALILSIFAVSLPVESAAPQRGGTLQIAHIANISSMDPHQVTAGFDLHITWAVFDPVVDIDQKMNLVPGLAVSWSQPSPTTWEFKLRQGVAFHDGTP